MPLTREVKIIKVPLSDRERIPDYPKSFPRMSRLYLELFENKAKIKQDLINKEYVPTTIVEEKRDQSDRGKEDRDRGKEDRDRGKEDHNRGKKDRDRGKEDRDRGKEDRDRGKEDRDRGKEDRDRGKEDRDRGKEDRDRSKEDSDRSKEDTVSENGSISDSVSVGSSNNEREKFTEDTEIHEGDSHSGTKSSKSSGSRSNSESNSESDSGTESNSRHKSEESDALSDRLKELLGDSSKSKESYSADKYSKSQKQSVESRASSHFTPYDKYKRQKDEEPQKGAPPPTLAELEARGHYHGKAELRDINHVGLSEYEEEDRKRELIFKFDLLKKSYPLAGPTIQEYTIHSDLREMQKSYDSTVRRLSLDSTVENYKTYLIGGFMLVEFVFGNFLGFDMQGFTQQQIVSMHSYEKLLIELGEKSYVPSGSKWPVELRLLFLIIMNAGFFIVSKMIMRKTGANLLNMVNNMNPVNNNSQSVPRPKRRMRGPNINVDDIPDADENNQPMQK
jgi:hypothetical protein